MSPTALGADPRAENNGTERKTGLLL